MILIINITTRKHNWLCPAIRLSMNAPYSREVSTPLPTLLPTWPTLTNKQTLVPKRVILRRDGTKVIRRHGHEDLPAAGIRKAVPLCTVRGVCPVWSVLVVHIVANTWWPSTVAAAAIAWGPRHSNGEYQCRIDAGLARHLWRDALPAFGTSPLPLPNPFLEALQTECVPTRSLQQTTLHAFPMFIITTNHSHFMFNHLLITILI